MLALIQRRCVVNHPAVTTSRTGGTAMFPFILTAENTAKIKRAQRYLRCALL